jgi:hypothetical protein
MKFVHCLALSAALLAAAGATAAPADTDKERKDNLVTLYLLSVAADRCGFAMTTRQADAIDRTAKSLVETLKLRTNQATAFYSEADIEFEKQGPKACDRNGSFAKTFKETLQKLVGP